ncbi:MAG: NifU family protein [Pyrinomonadaceae bacterium MAG19_C2-C3]|nr:NifU family protein [Pyrinomonadaceae bacterium MAG19_C2-C3]
MSPSANMKDVEASVEGLNALVEELEQYPDAELREKVLDLVQIILELHGEALRRVLTTLDSLPGKEQALTRLMSDDVVRAILLIHGLLPVNVETRVAAAIYELRPHLLAQGCDVELLGIEDGRARLRLMRSGKGAPPVAVLKSEIEKSLVEAVPDLAGVDIEGFAEQIAATAKAAAILSSRLSARSDAPQSTRLVQIKRAATHNEGAGGVWVSVIRSLGFAEGALKIIKSGEINLLVCKINDEFYAYRNACAAAPELTFDDALFESPVLVCSCHAYHYDLRRRGTCLERPELRLESLDLEIKEDKVKVRV